MTTERLAGAAALLEHLELHARTTCRHLENQGRLTDGFTDHYYPLTKQETATANRYRAAFTLAPDLDSCRALLKGERVPTHRLDQTMLAAHQRRLRGR